MKSVLVSVLVLCACAAGAGNVCVWSGAAGDGKWSTAGNWENGLAPVSGNNDRVVFISGDSPLTVSNDVANLDLGYVTTSNLNAVASVLVTIAGNEFTLSGVDGVTRIACSCATTFDTPITFACDLKAMFMATADFTFNGDLTLNGSGTTTLGGGGTGDNAAIKPNVYFYGRIDGPNARIDAVNEFNNGYEYYYHYGPVVLRQYNAGMEYRNNLCYFYATGNDVKTLCVVGYGSAYFEKANAFAADNKVVQYSTLYGPSIGGQVSFFGDQSFAKWSVDATKGSKRTRISGAYTLTLTPSENLSLPTWLVDGTMSVHWAPTGDYSLTLSAATNATSGSLLVDRGTLKFGDAVRFTALKKLNVAANAGFEVGSGSEDCFGTTPAVVVSVASSSTVKLDADVKVKSLYIDGMMLTNTTYSAANGDSWITGTGTLTVTTPADATTTFWNGPVEGDFNLDANWTLGIPLATTNGYLTKWGSYAKISETTDVLGKLYVSTTQGTNTLETAADTYFGNTLAIGDGMGPGTALLKITEGTTTFASAPALKADGRIEVSGDAKFVVSNTFATTGGSVLLSGNAEMVDALPSQNYYFRFKTGTLTLTENSKIKPMVNSSSRNYFGANAEGDTSLVEVKDNAFFDMSGGDGTYFALGAPKNSLSKFVFSGHSRASFGNGFTVLHSGTSSAVAELVVEDDAYLYQPAYGMTGGAGAGTFNMRMNGGCFDCYASNNSYFQPSGFKIGCKTSNARSSTPARANLYFDGGVITNRGYSMTYIGAGDSVGRVVQTGGLYLSKPTSWSRAATFTTPPIVLGYLGGEGSWELSGGEVRNTTMLFVGGITTNATGHSYKPTWSETYSFASNRSAEKGVLTITGGVFENQGDAYVSYDGPGFIEMGAAGELKANNLYLTHSTDKEDPSKTHIASLKFTPGAATAGTITLTGALDVETDAVLTVDARAYTEKKSIWLLKAASVTRNFVLGNVTFTKSSPAYSLLCNDQGIKLVCNSGTVLTLR